MKNIFCLLSVMSFYLLLDIQSYAAEEEELREQVSTLASKYEASLLQSDDAVKDGCDVLREQLQTLTLSSPSYERVITAAHMFFPRTTSITYALLYFDHVRCGNVDALPAVRRSIRPEALNGILFNTGRSCRDTLSHPQSLTREDGLSFEEQLAQWIVATYSPVQPV